MCGGFFKWWRGRGQLTGEAMANNWPGKMGGTIDQWGKAKIDLKIKYLIYLLVFKGVKEGGKQQSTLRWWYQKQQQTINLGKIKIQFTYGVVKGGRRKKTKKSTGEALANIWSEKNECTCCIMFQGGKGAFQSGYPPCLLVSLTMPLSIPHAFQTSSACFPTSPMPSRISVEWSSHHQSKTQKANCCTTRGQLTIYLCKEKQSNNLE